LSFVPAEVLFGASDFDGSGFEDASIFPAAGFASDEEGSDDEEDEPLPPAAAGADDFLA
jgi:hypothetical protein